MEVIGLKELRQNINTYIKLIGQGKSFLIARKSKPVFKITSPNDDDGWEEVIDFTKINKGGVKIQDILSRL